MKLNLRAGFWSALGALAGVLLVGCKTSSSVNDFSEVSGGAPVVIDPGPADAGTGTAGGSGTTTAPGSTPAIATASGSNRTVPNPTGLMRVGDLLTVTYSDTPVALTPFEGRIREDGTITLVFNKTFVAAGKTPNDLEKEIHDAYVPRLFKFMTVNVKWVESARFYYVGGEVKAPGQHPYLARIKILEAIKSAGDFTEFARRGKVTLTRADGTKLIVDCKKAQKIDKLNVEVLPGDSINVPKSPI